MYIIKSGALYDVSGGTEKEFQSPFAEEFYNEDQQTWERESWKFKDNAKEAEPGIVSRSMLWGGRGKGGPPAKVKFSYVCAAPGRLYYVLEMSKSAGLFYFDFATGQETRLFHRSEFEPHGLFVDNEYGILTALTNNDGSVHITEYDANGKRERMLTSGDCRDENAVRRGSTIYYQSRGLARNEAGVVAARGPAAICKLDTSTGDIDTVLEDPKCDFVLPRVTAEGVLYCIRAPYDDGPVYPLKNRLLDIILFPWRLLVAIFAFLNVFSIFFAKKPLTTAGGPERPAVDMSQRIMHDRVVNIQKTWREEGKKVAVSKHWKLIRYENGQSTEVASNVLWFDLDASGQPYFTDGYSLYDAAGSKKLTAEEMISSVAVA